MSDKPPSACVAEYDAGHGEPFAKGRLPVSLAFACDVGTDRRDAIGVVQVVRQLRHLHSRQRDRKKPFLTACCGIPSQTRIES